MNSHGSSDWMTCLLEMKRRGRLAPNLRDGGCKDAVKYQKKNKGIKEAKESQKMHILGKGG